MLYEPLINYATPKNWMSFTNDSIYKYKIALLVNVITLKNESYFTEFYNKSYNMVINIELSALV